MKGVSYGCTKHKVNKLTYFILNCVESAQGPTYRKDNAIQFHHVKCMMDIMYSIKSHDLFYQVT